MKKLLLTFLTPIIAMSPIVAVVACGKDSSSSDTKTLTKVKESLETALDITTSGNWSAPSSIKTTSVITKFTETAAKSLGYAATFELPNEITTYSPTLTYKVTNGETVNGKKGYMLKIIIRVGEKSDSLNIALYSQEDDVKTDSDIITEVKNSLETALDITTSGNWSSPDLISSVDQPAPFTETIAVDLGYKQGWTMPSEVGQHSPTLTYRVIDGDSIKDKRGYVLIVIINIGNANAQALTKSLYSKESSDVKKTEDSAATLETALDITTSSNWSEPASITPNETETDFDATVAVSLGYKSDWEIPTDVTNNSAILKYTIVPYTAVENKKGYKLTISVQVGKAKVVLFAIKLNSKEPAE